VGAGAFEWRGGHPALDFTNTLSWGAGRPSEERLLSYDALVEWAALARLPIAPAELRRIARRRPAEAARALARAREMRSLVHRILETIARGGRPRRADLAPFNSALRRAVRGLEVRARTRGVGCEFRWDGRELERPVSILIWLTAELLRSDELGRLRACGNPLCGWLFLDRSRRGNRRWCDMQVCGSRDKARRYYYRSRALAGHAASGDAARLRE
jgi:predicted RNA-binding Zn ribbon-like protein